MCKDSKGYFPGKQIQRLKCNSGETWLRITGPEGVKEFIDKELEL